MPHAIESDDCKTIEGNERNGTPGSDDEKERKRAKRREAHRKRRENMTSEEKEKMRAKRRENDQRKELELREATEELAMVEDDESMDVSDEMGII